MKDKRILLLDTKDKPHDLLKTFYSLDFEMTAISNSNQLAHNIKENGYKTAIINIHHNDEFELLEHISKISLTYPEVAIVLLTPEAIQPSLNWGPKVFSMVKPISAYSVLKKLSLFNDEQFPYDGVIRGEVLLSLLDRSLASESSYKITLNYEDKYKAEILTRKGKWVSLYINDSLKNNKLLLPFNWEGAFYKVEETENAEIGEFEITDENYTNFRKNLSLWLSLVNKLPSPLTVMRLDQEKFDEIRIKLPDTVEEVIKYIDDKNSLLDILIKVKMRPFYAVQNLSYLYFNDCIELKDEEGNFYKDEDSSEGLDVEKVVDIISSLNYFNKPKKRRNSKELASWIMDPMGAAKELEQELKKNIRKNRDSGPQKRGRKKRRTQPGLGDLIDILQSKAESSKQIDNNKWKNPEKKKEKKQFNSVKSNNDLQERIPETLQGLPFAGIELDSNDALLDVEYKRQESKSGIIELKSYIEKNIQNKEDNKREEEEWKPIAKEDLNSPLEELSNIRETRKRSGYLPIVSEESKYSKKFRNKLEKIRKNKDSIRIKTDNLVELESSEDKSGELLSQEKTAEKSKEEVEKQEETEVTSEVKEITSDEKDKTAENLTDSESEPKDSGKIEVSEEEVYDVDAMEKQIDSTETEAAEVLEDSEFEEEAKTEEAAEEITEVLSDSDNAKPEENLERTSSSDKDSVFEEVETFEIKAYKNGSGWKLKIFLLIVIIGAGLGVYNYLKNRSNPEMEYSHSSAKTKDKIKASGTAKKNVENSKKINKNKNIVETGKSKSSVKKEKEVKTEDKAKVDKVKTVENKKDKVKKHENIEENNKIKAFNKKLAAKIKEYYKQNRSTSVFLKLLKSAENNKNISAKNLEKLATISYKRGRIESAWDFSQKSLKLDKDRAEAWWITGLINYEKRNKEAYVKALKRYIELRPNDKKRIRKIRQLGIK